MATNDLQASMARVKKILEGVFVDTAQSISKRIDNIVNPVRIQGQESKETKQQGSGKKRTSIDEEQEQRLDSIGKRMTTFQSGKAPTPHADTTEKKTDPIYRGVQQLLSVLYQLLIKNVATVTGMKPAVPSTASGGTKPGTGGQPAGALKPTAVPTQGLPAIASNTASNAGQRLNRGVPPPSPPRPPSVSPASVPPPSPPRAPGVPPAPFSRSNPVSPGTPPPAPTGPSRAPGAPPPAPYSRSNPPPPGPMGGPPPAPGGTGKGYAPIPVPLMTRLSRGLEKVSGGARQVADFAGKSGMHEEEDKAGKAADLAMTGARAAAGDPTAMVKLAMEAKKAIEEKIGQAKAVGGHLMNAATSQTAEGAASEGFSAVESAGKFAGPAGKPLEYIGKFGKMVADSVDGLRKWNDSLHDSNMQFAEFSAAMSRVEAAQEIFDIEQGRTRGNRRADSAMELMEARSKLNAALSPIEDKLANIQNTITARLTEYVVEGVEYLKGIAESLGISLAGGGKDDKDTLPNWMQQTGLEDFKKAIDARPPRFKK